jgi:6-phosphogluconate dehydrogenase
MDVGMVGLGRMGANMAERLVRAGHRVVGYARRPEAVQAVASRGIAGATSLPALVQALPAPRVLWLMIPAGPAVDQAIQQLVPLLARGDILVDGGNSYYRDSQRRAAALAPQGIPFVDVGTSGGVWGLTVGYSLMVGGDANAVARLTPLFEALAPSSTTGWGHVGPSGAGHFVKMVHNGIEYGLMQAYAEGLSVLRQKAEFHLDLQQVSEIWRNGSVVRSWLLDLIAEGLRTNPDLTGIGGAVADSGEGRWTVQEAIELGVSTPVIALSLLRRLRSREIEPFGDKLLALMRHEFGGHAVEPDHP